MRLIKLKNNSAEGLDLLQDRVLNVITLVCAQGWLPSEAERNQEGGSARWWHPDERDPKRFYILSASNNNWVKVVGQGGGERTGPETNAPYIRHLHYATRYDQQGVKKAAIEASLLAFFSDTELEIIERA